LTNEYSIAPLSSFSGFITPPFDKPGGSWVPDGFAFVYKFWISFPGATSFDNRISQVELVAAGRASLGIELIEQRKVDDMSALPGRSYGHGMNLF
jgi:hypothetical protein